MRCGSRHCGMVAGFALRCTQIAARCSNVSADASKAKVIREIAARLMVIKKVRIVSLLVKPRASEAIVTVRGSVGKPLQGVAEDPFYHHLLEPDRVQNVEVVLGTLVARHCLNDNRVRCSR